MIILAIAICLTSCSNSNQSTNSKADNENLTATTMEASITTTTSIESTTTVQTTKSTQTTTSTQPTTQTTFTHTIIEPTETSTGSAQDLDELIPGIAVSEIITAESGDFFMINDCYYRIGAEIPWVNEYIFSKGDLLGEITVCKATGELENGSASNLNVGTKIYQFSDNKQILLAETEHGLIPYIVWAEG